MNSSIPSESIVDIQRVLMFLLFLMFLLRKVPKLDILRLGLHYIFAGCGLVELGNVKKNPGNVWKSFLTQMCKVPFIFCLFSLSLFFSSRYFSLAMLYSRLWNFPTILFQIEKTAIEIEAENISDFTGILTIDEL